MKSLHHLDYSRASIPIPNVLWTSSVAVADSGYEPPGLSLPDLWSCDYRGGLGSALPALLPQSQPGKYELQMLDHTCRTDDGVSRKDDYSLPKLWNILQPVLKRQDDRKNLFFAGQAPSNLCH